VSWTVPSTWVIGQLVSAAEMNEQVRDNLLHLKQIVNDDGKIPEISSTYFDDLSGANLTDVAHLSQSNDFTDGVHDFGAGSGARLVIPVGSDRWAT